MNAVSPDEIGPALIEQVMKATPSGHSELSVVTYISREMWNLWLEFVLEPPGTEPTEWLGMNGTVRVYGSKTIVVEREGLFSVSRPMI